MQEHRAQQKNMLILLCQKQILFFIPQGQTKQSWAKTLNTVKQAYIFSYLLLKYRPDMQEKNSTQFFLSHSFSWLQKQTSKHILLKQHDQIFRIFSATLNFAEVGRASCHSAAHCHSACTILQKSMK